MTGKEVTKKDLLHLCCSIPCC